MKSQTRLYELYCYYIIIIIQNWTTVNNELKAACLFLTIKLLFSQLQSALDYRDSLYCHADDKFLTHHCSLFHKVWYILPHWQKVNHLVIFIFQALLLMLPNYLTSLFSLRFCNYSTWFNNPNETSRLNKVVCVAATF